MIENTTKLFLAVMSFKLNTYSSTSQAVSITTIVLGVIINLLNTIAAIKVIIQVKQIRDEAHWFSNVYGPGVCSSLRIIEERIITSAKDRVRNGIVRFIIENDMNDRIIGTNYRTDANNNMMKVPYMKETTTWYRSMYTCAIATAAIAIMMIITLTSITIISIHTWTWPIAPLAATLVMSILNAISTIVWWMVGKHVVTHYHWRAVLMGFVRQKVRTETRLPTGIVEEVRYFGTQRHDNDTDASILPPATGHQLSIIDSSRETLSQAIKDFEDIRNSSCFILSAVVSALVWIIFVVSTKDGIKSFESNTSSAALSIINIIGISTISKNIFSLFSAKDNSRLSLKTICTANKMYGSYDANFEEDIARDLAIGFGALRYKLGDAMEWDVTLVNNIQANNHYFNVNTQLVHRVMQVA